MTLHQLTVLITITGIAFLLFSLVVVFLGKRVGEGRGGKQRIKIRDVDLELNAVLMLVVIAVIVVLAPLWFAYQKAEWVSKDELTRSYIAYKDLSLVIHGSVESEDGMPTEGATVAVERKLGTPHESGPQPVDQMGMFWVELDSVAPREEFTITCAKEGYIRKQVRFSMNQLPLVFRLTRTGGSS